jgi:hypothetical protein
MRRRLAHPGSSVGTRSENAEDRAARIAASFAGAIALVIKGDMSEWWSRDPPDFWKCCHSQISARTSNDPISAATTSRSEMANFVESGEDSEQAEHQPADKSADQTDTRDCGECRSLCAPCDYQSGQASPKQADNDPNDDLID